MPKSRIHRMDLLSRIYNYAASSLDSGGDMLCCPIFTTLTGSGTFIIPSGFEAHVYVNGGGVDPCYINGVLFLNVTQKTFLNSTQMCLTEGDTITGGSYHLTLYEKQ